MAASGRAAAREHCYLTRRGGGFAQLDVAAHSCGHFRSPGHPVQCWAGPRKNGYVCVAASPSPPSVPPTVYFFGGFGGFGGGGGIWYTGCTPGA